LDDLKTYTLLQHKAVGNSFSTLPLNIFKLLCEKTDPSGKCVQYNNSSTNISDECLTELYSKECPGFDLNLLKDTFKNEKISYGYLKYHPTLLKTSPMEISKKICFGSDKSKWPEPCSYFKDESYWVTDDCVKDIWTKSGCTKEQPIYGSIKSLKEIKDDINNISTSTDPEMKSKCN